MDVTNLNVLEECNEKYELFRIADDLITLEILLIEFEKLLNDFILKVFRVVSMTL